MNNEEPLALCATDRDNTLVNGPDHPARRLKGQYGLRQGAASNSPYKGNWQRPAVPTEFVVSLTSDAQRQRYATGRLNSLDDVLAETGLLFRYGQAIDQTDRLRPVPQARLNRDLSGYKADWPDR